MKHTFLLILVFIPFLVILAFAKATCNDFEDTVEVSQLGVFCDEAKLNILSVVASIEQNETGKVNIASNLLDGDVGTRWSGERIDAYDDVILSSAANVPYIKLCHNKGDEYTSSFHLWAWNNETAVYDTLLSSTASVMNDEILTLYDFDNVETDKSRFVGLAYSNVSGTWAVIPY